MSGFYIFLSLIVLVCFLLILVIMVQNPKGGGLSASAFGGGGNQVVGGVKKTSDFLEKSTWTLAALLFLFVLLSNYTLGDSFSDAGSRVIDSPVQNDDFLDDGLEEETGTLDNIPATDTEQPPAKEEGTE